MACQCELEYAKLKALEKSTNRRVMARGELGPNSERFAVSSDEVWLMPAYKMVLERIDNDENWQIEALDSKLGDLREQYRKLCWSFCVKRTPNEDYAQLAYENLVQQMSVIRPHMQDVIFKNNRDRGSDSLLLAHREDKLGSIVLRYTPKKFHGMMADGHKNFGPGGALMARRFVASLAFTVSLLGTMAVLGVASETLVFGLGATFAYYLSHRRLVEPLLKKLILKIGEKKAQKTAAPNAIAATDTRRLVAGEAGQLEYDIGEYSLFEKAADAELKVEMGISQP
ncbi:MAG: hypothetical protein M1530_02555 [Candidatus Marsarchaeota archaeon]|nr:hypothetical protein [Candidatus Marsarchaeota archaeon]